MSCVLEIADYAAPYKGNFIPSLLSLADALQKENVQTVFLFPDRARNCAWIAEIAACWPVQFLPRGIVKTARMLRRIRRTYDVQSVHTHFIDKSVYIPLRIACGKTAHVFHAHSLPKFTLEDPLFPLRRSLLHARQILCVSEPVADGYRQCGFRNCVTIPNGVDFSRLDGCDPLPLPHPLALCFGYDFRIKGIDTILDAFTRQNTYTLGLCVAGHMDEAREALCAAYGGIPPRVLLLPGREDVGAYYKSADVFVSASRQEGMPYAVLEAAYCGLPLVLSAIAPHKSLALPGVRYFPPEDADALLRAVMQTQDDAYAHRRRETVLRRFSLAQWTRDVQTRLLAQESAERPEK